MRESAEQKTASGVRSTEDGSGQMSFPGVKIPAQDYITAWTPRQGTIAELLRRGRGNALTCREISRITGLHHREITQRICAERRHGAPILSSSSGFWIAEDVAELKQCVSALHTRAGEIHKTARALERSMMGTMEDSDTK